MSTTVTSIPDGLTNGAQRAYAALVAAGPDGLTYDDWMGATGLARHTLQNVASMLRSRRLARDGDDGQLIAVQAEAPPAPPAWEQRLTDLFFLPLGPALAPLLPISRALEAAAEACDEAAHRQATIVDDLAALAGERRTLEERQRTLARAGAADGDIDAVDDTLARVGVRYDRRVAVLPGALRQHGRAQLELLAAIKTALVRAADDGKAQLGETSAAWTAATRLVETLTNARESVQRDDQLEAATADLARLREQRQPETAALAILDEAYRFVPVLVQKAEVLADLREAAVPAWIQAAERIPEQVALLREMQRSLADAGVSAAAEARLAELRTQEAAAIAARRDYEAAIGAHRVDRGAIQGRIAKRRLELRWLRGLPVDEEAP